MIRLNKNITSPLLGIFALIVSLLFAACQANQPNQGAPNNANQAIKPPVATPNETKSESPESETKTVTIEQYQFAPAEITVSVGTKVTWRNKDDVGHSVTSDAKVFDSGIFGKDKEFSYVFDKAGTYLYHCTPHPQMKARVIAK